MLQDLYKLLARFSDMGITHDIATMSLCEQWGIYRLLKRMDGESL